MSCIVFVGKLKKQNLTKGNPKHCKPRLATGFCFACFFFHFCVRTTSRGIPIFWKTFSRKFSFHSTLLPECLEFSVEWFVFRKFNSFGISRNFSGKFLFHLKLFPNVWKFWLKDYRFVGNPLGILDSTLWIPNSRYWIPDSLAVELGFRIPIVSGIPDSLS